MSMCRIILVAAVIVMAAHAWTDQQLVEGVERVCPAGNLVCPKEEFGIFEGYDWTWNAEAIVNAPMARVFKILRNLNDDTIKALKEEYCCTSGPCLHRCGIFEKSEIDLIAQFPRNAQEILDLGLTVIEPHREYLTQWLATHDTTRFPRGRLDAELEEYFDTLFFNQDLVRTKLAEARFQKALGLDKATAEIPQDR